MTAERYAVYFVPPHDSALAAFGRAWLGIDIDTGETCERTSFAGISDERLRALTDAPRLYGFYGTIKPPFALATHTSVDGLLSAARLCAQSMSTTEIPPLEVAVIGKFLALSPIKSSVKLAGLATSCVRALEGFRRPLSDKEAAQYRQSKLTVHQEQMLDHWGYPFVLEEFRFHMTLTDRIDDGAERESVYTAAEAACEPFLGNPVAVTEIAVCVQSAPSSAMKIIERIPIGRKRS